MSKMSFWPLMMSGDRSSVCYLDWIYTHTHTHIYIYIYIYICTYIKDIYKGKKKWKLYRRKEKLKDFTPQGVETSYKRIGIEGKGLIYR